MSKLTTARKNVGRHEWCGFVFAEGIVCVDLPLVARMPADAAMDYAHALLHTWKGICARLGEPHKNPAQAEFFPNGGDRAYHFATVDGSLYISHEKMMPY